MLGCSTVTLLRLLVCALFVPAALGWGMGDARIRTPNLRTPPNRRLSIRDSRQVRPTRPPVKPKVIVHIGMFKTATTTMQVTMRLNRQLLARRGVYYAIEQGSNMNEFAGWLKDGDVERARERLAKIRAEAAAMRSHTIIISSEVLVFLTHRPQELAEFRRMFDDLEVDVHVVFRNQYDFIRSWMQEKLKSGLSIFEGSPEWLGWKLQYSNIISTWEKAFGPEHVKVHCYEELQGDSVLMFLQEARALSSRAPLSPDTWKKLGWLGFSTPSYDVNTSPDPGTQAMMLLSGLSESKDDYKEWFNHYRKAFDGSNKYDYAFTSYMVEATLASAVGDEQTLNHPKLDKCRAFLDRRINTDKHPTPLQRVDYLMKLHAFTGLLLNHEVAKVTRMNSTAVSS